MAIGAGAAGAWAATNATTATVTLPSHSAGDLLVVIAAAKASTITSVDPTITTPATGWTRIASFADGTTNSGNGTGSVRQAIFYKIATSGAETNPVVTWGGSQTAAPGLDLGLSFTKAAGEVWLQPVAVQAATTNATAIVVVMGSNPGITVGDWGVICHTTRDDSALTVPSWTATGATLAAVVEYPATAIASGTSNDMAGDAAYRSVTSGTASVPPTVTGTQAAAETGVTAFIRLRVATAAPQTVTPTTASLATSTFAPTVSVPNNITVTPTTKAATLTTFAPTVLAPRLLTPATTALTTTTLAPVIGVQVTPSTSGLTLTTFAPDVTVEAGGVTVTPDAVSLSTSAFAPVISAPRLVVPSTAALTSSTFAPTVTAPQLVTPAVADLSTATFAATVTATNHQVATPTPQALVLGNFAPTVTATSHVTARPTTRELSLQAFAPEVQATQHWILTPPPAAVALTAYAPRVRILNPAVNPAGWIRSVPRGGMRFIIKPYPASFLLQGYPPTVIHIDDFDVFGMLERIP